MFQCRICSSQQQPASYAVKEMQLGIRAEFTYQLCGDCGCLQIERLPENLAAYYPSDYYSKKTRTVKTTDRLMDYFRQKRLQNHLGVPNALGAGLMRLLGPPRLPDWVRWVPLKANFKPAQKGFSEFSRNRPLHRTTYYLPQRRAGI